MKTLTRNQVARKLGVTNNHLLYWEGQGELQPKKLKIGERGLILYNQAMLEKAKKLLFSGKRRKKAKK